MQNNPETCGGEHDEHDLPVVPRVKAEVRDDMTLAELKKLPLTDVLDHLVINPIKTVVREYGPKGNIFFRPMLFTTIGSKVEGHAHNYDHVTYIRKGSVNVLAWHIDDQGNKVGEPTERNYVAPCAILIKKAMVHELTSLEDGTEADCVYALRDSATGEVAEDWDGNLHPYV